MAVYDPIIDALPWKRQPPPYEHAVPHCAALGWQASFKGTALICLKECKDDQYLLYPCFRRLHGEYFLASTIT